MRRFELSSEDKFWQIEQRDLTLRISFGKIGHSGQTQIKRCADEDEVKSETARFIAEKVKKGFVEKKDDDESGEASAAPTPAPKAKPQAAASPTPTPPTPTPTPTRTPTPAPTPTRSAATAIDTTAKAFQRAAPLPASGYAFKPKPAGETFRRLHDRMKEFSPALDAGVKTSNGPMKALLLAVIEAYGDDAPAAKLSIETEAAAYRLFAPPKQWRDSHAGELFGRYWVAKEGGEFALQALAKASMLARETAAANTWSEPKTLSVTEAPHTEASTWGEPDEVWRPIREWVASLDAAELERIRGVVAELRKNMNVATRALLDAGLGDPEFCAEDASEIVTSAAGTNAAPLTLWPVLFSMTDVNAVESHIDKLATQWALNACGATLPQLVATLGVRAAPALKRVLEAGMKSNFGAERVREFGEALALIRSAEVADVMAEQLASKDMRPIATEWLQNSPELAIVPLAHRAVGKGATADIAKSVLGAVVSKVPAEAHRVAAELGEAHRAVIENALSRFEDLVDADASEIPRVLASPPWLEKKRAKAPRVVTALRTIARAPKVVWESEAQKTEFKNEQSYYAPDPSKEKEILKEIQGAISAKAASVGSYKLMQLPKASAIHTLETAPLEIFSWYYGNVASSFIGRYELDALTAVLRYATVDPTNAIEAFAVVDAQAVAPMMADAFVRLKKSRQNAIAWLMKFPESAAVGLIPNAIGVAGKPRAAAEAALRYMASHGKRAVIEKVAEAYGDDAKEALADVLDFDPLSDFPAKMPKMPGFFNAGALPRPRLKGTKKVLPVSAVDALGTMLAFARIDEPYAGVAQVKEACDAQSLAELSWELFQAWLVAGAPSKEQWAFHALSHFGDDDCARKLTPLVRAWPGEAAHARAVIGLDVLAAIGTDVALMHLHGIAQKVKFKGLQERAREKIDQIAEARGLTAEELGDRLVPDLGLEDDGSLILDFGPRKFRVAFDETLKPILLDEGGKRVKDLPKPGKSDEAEKAEAAVATWKALKKDSKTVATSQLLRLELAMCSQRRWDQDGFQQFFVDHPLLIHIVRRLIWGAFDAKGKLVSSFRVSEDRSFADPKDAKYTVPDGAMIGIVHRLHMEQKDADAWGQVLGDYEIMQPFSQLSREAITPTPEELEATDLSRVAGITVPTGKVLGLDHRGWRRGPPQDGGVVCWYEKHLGDGWVVCMDLDPGIYTGMIAESPQQKLGKCVIAKDANSWRRESLKKLGELSPIEFSELVRDLESVRI